MVVNEAVVRTGPVSRADDADNPKTITVLGATGSVGQNTLDVISSNPGRYAVEVLTAQSNVAELAELAIAHRAKLAVIADDALLGALRQALAGTGIEAAAGRNALVEAAQRPVSMVMAAIVGSAGLAPTLAAVRCGTDIALANKECLVTAGGLFMSEVRASGATLVPVDSEHSGVFQALDGQRRDQVEKIILTASGGPFRESTLEEMERAGPSEALRHPNWQMGRKLTIDSATMMNKGIELIEAHHLFSAEPDLLDVLVHPQSIVHGLVEYSDGSVLAQMGSPDMRKPISYALGWPERIGNRAPRLDLARIGTLSFEAVDPVRFPSIGICRAVMGCAPGAQTVLNAANEVAVSRFLDGALGFLDIVRIVRHTVDAAETEGLVIAPEDLETVEQLDRFGREKAAELARALQ